MEKMKAVAAKPLPYETEMKVNKPVKQRNKNVILEDTTMSYDALKLMLEKTKTTTGARTSVLTPSNLLLSPKTNTDTAVTSKRPSNALFSTQSLSRANQVNYSFFDHFPPRQMPARV
jgi:hypothetical protein